MNSFVCPTRSSGCRWMPRSSNCMPTRGNADAFISGTLELHGDAPQRDVYLKYIDERPGSNGLFTDEGVPIVLSQVQKEMTEHPGNIWTHIISLRREDAERLGYNNTDAWMHLLRSQRNMIAQQMKIAPENFRWYAHSTTKATIRTFT